jgi:hypothetical protein
MQAVKADNGKQQSADSTLQKGAYGTERLAKEPQCSADGEQRFCATAGSRD